MNLSREQQKQELRETRDQLKGSLQQQVSDWKERSTQVGKTMLWVGGIFAVAYLVYKTFLEDEEEKLSRPKNRTHVPNEENLPSAPLAMAEEPSIISSIKGHIIAFLVAIAREKILEALSNLNKTHEKSNDTSNI
jgi:RNA polymerase-interacting CarD/CdnL/TRCF family regulator